MKADKQDFINEAERRLVQLFHHNKSGAHRDDIEKHRIEGFMQAGVFAGLATPADMLAIQERACLQVYGVSLAEKKRASQPFAAISQDYSRYDSPAHERKKR